MNTRQQYLQHCMQVSVTKRWYWPVTLAVLSAGLCLLLNTTPTILILAPLLAALLTLAAVALNSWQRHQHDYEAQPRTPLR